MLLIKLKADVVATFSESKSAPSWKTMPMRARSSKSRSPCIAVDSRPKTRILRCPGGEAVGELQQHALAAAGGPSRMRVSPVLHLKGDVLENLRGRQRRSRRLKNSTTGAPGIELGAC